MILVLKVTNINREELTFSSCTSLDDVTPWCYTRIQVGRVSFPNFSNCRKTCWPLTATGVTARLPAPGSCPLPPASTVSLLDQIFGTLRSSTSPPGVLAFATHMIRPLRWLLFDCQPKKLPQIPYFFCSRLNRECLGSCMHCWDISEFLFMATPVYQQPFPETRLCLWMSSLVSIFTCTTKASSGQALKWAS